ncbi:MAG: hypothetical protein NVS3B16_24780 [Vulcanimicrobiaceae bacterium]
MTNADKNPCSSVSPEGYRCTRMRHADAHHEARTDHATAPVATWSAVPDLKANHFPGFRVLESAALLDGRRVVLARRDNRGEYVTGVVSVDSFEHHEWASGHYFDRIDKAGADYVKRLDELDDVYNFEKNSVITIRPSVTMLDVMKRLNEGSI